MHPLVTQVRAGRLTLAALLVFALSACGGGGTHSLPRTAVPTALPTSGNAVTPTSSVQMKLSFHRGTHPVTKRSARRKGALAIRTPKYVSGSTQGMVIVATSTSGSVTTYYSLSTSSSNCTTSVTQNSIVSCTVTVPFAGFHQTMVATVMDSTPTTDGSGNPNGFAATANVLGVGSGTFDFTQGTANAISMTISPVAGQINDDFAYAATNGAYIDTADYTQAPNLPPFDGFAPYGPAVAQLSRLVVGAGTPTQGLLQFGIFDRTGNYAVGAPIVATPFVDVNGATTPLSVTANNAALSVFAVPYNSMSAPAYAATSSIPDLSYQWDNGGGSTDVDFSYNGSVFTSATIVVSNNLTATPAEPGVIDNPISSDETAGPTYAATLTYLVTPISASPTALTLTSLAPTSVTATDWHAVDGVYAGSVGSNGNDGNCVDAGGNVLATVSASNPIDTGSWQQTFAVTASSLGETGTCTFVTVDADSYSAAQPVFSQPIVVTLNT
jgi:hypothetical protein